MINRRTRIQLIVFALITLIGVAFVGARYAQLDRLVVDRAYTVTAHAEESGGIFAGAEVTYRGVGIGKVDELRLTEQGVDIVLQIDRQWDQIPTDSRALVGNRSAVGEQYLELQPRTDAAPYLQEGSQIAEVTTPISTAQLLGDIAGTVSSINRKDLSTTIESLGQAFAGTGEDLQRIIDTGNDFIDLAQQNFDLTTALIRDGNTVLRGQADTESSLRVFARDLSAFTTAVAGADKDLRAVIDSGSLAADQLRTLLEQNDVHLSSLLRNLVTTGEVVVANLPGVKQLLILYPYAVAGAYTVVAKSPGSGRYDAHFGLALGLEVPGNLGGILGHKLCREGYESTDRRGPNEGDNIPMNTKAGCTEPITESNARGPQNLSRVQPLLSGGQSTPVARYDIASGTLTWGAPAASSTGSASRAGSVAPPSLGEDSWEWLYLQPLMGQ
ncbi:MCE family protein [Nocardioides sp. GY 10113]|uniref:MlaD family protein n=1 Tax=Nocardioides sp. GY 10113 TaxID=2569761 RepID=UPI0010A79EAE|nr:MlaD family protein [Nocardioides sp. GY 10113]TIC89329.1 MCE family protein [Nocardioides sp. GY 10113]